MARVSIHPPPGRAAQDALGRRIAALGYWLRTVRPDGTWQIAGIPDPMPARPVTVETSGPGGPPVAAVTGGGDRLAVARVVDVWRHPDPPDGRLLADRNAPAAVWHVLLRLDPRDAAARDRAARITAELGDELVEAVLEVDVLGRWWIRAPYGP